MDLRTIATVIWRVIGGVFLIYGFATAIVQFGAVTGTFGQIMDGESLYTGATIFAMFLWPMVLGLTGIIVFLTSRSLADLVVRGLDTNDR